MKLYRDFATQEEIDADYNALGNVADPEAIIRGWVERSEATAARPARAGSASTTGRRLPSIATCSRPARAPRSTSSSTAATGAASRPATTSSSPGRWSSRRARHGRGELRALPERHARRDRAAGPGGIAWAFAPWRRVRRRPDRLTISGHSAGGHLVAMAAGHRLGGRLRAARRPDQGCGRDQRALRSRLRPVQLSPAQGPGELGPGRAPEPDPAPAAHGPATARRGGRRRDRRVPAAVTRLPSPRWRCWPAQHLSRAAGQAPPDRAGGAGAARERAAPGTRPIAHGAGRRALVDLVRLGHGRLELFDREARLTRRRQDRRFAAGAEIDRRRHLAQRVARDDHRTMLVGMDQVAWPHASCHARRPRGRSPRHAPRRGSGRRSRRGAGSRSRSCRDRGSSRW